jgi:hypothetical protein
MTFISFPSQELPRRHAFVDFSILAQRRSEFCLVFSRNAPTALFIQELRTQWRQCPSMIFVSNRVSHAPSPKEEKLAKRVR